MMLGTQWHPSRHLGFLVFPTDLHTPWCSTDTGHMEEEGHGPGDARSWYYTKLSKGIIGSKVTAG